MIRAIIALTALLIAAGCASALQRLQSAPASANGSALEIVGPPPTIGSEPADPIELTGNQAGADVVDDSGDLLLASIATTGEVSGKQTIVAHGASPWILARTDPDESALIIQGFNNPTERGGPLVFQATGEPVDGWIEVLLPIRPNGSKGWLQVADVTLNRNPYRIDLDVDRYELTVFRDDEAVLSTTVAIGTGATPTPIGDFFLTELFQPPDPNGSYGPYAYGLSGFSDTLDSFNGGPGIIGIHGTNQPELLGTNVSHGCVRVDNTVISEMAALLPLGTPISIHR